MKQYRVRKGKHGFTPYLIDVRRTISTVVWDGMFGQGTDYALPYPDNRDWNKGGGFSFDLLTNHEDSFMWGWRWNADVQAHELCAYCHIDGVRKVAKNGKVPVDPADPEVMLRVPFGQKFRVLVEVRDGAYWFVFASGRAANRCFVIHTHKKRWARRIGPWFGGNRAAPQDMELFYTV